MTGSDGATSSLIIRLFGRFEVRVGGAPLPPLRSRKGEYLLAVLAMRAGSELDRMRLSGILWPDSPEPESLASLRKSLKDLRHALGPEACRLRSPTLRTLCLDVAEADVDVLSFDQAIARGHSTSLEQAVALYRGPLLEGCTEEWAFQERQVREQAYLEALETLATDALARGDPMVAERRLRQAVAVDPLRENGQRLLIQALAAGDDTVAALRVYQEFRLRLQRELDAEPDPATTALFEQIRGRTPRPVRVPSPLPRPEVRRSNLAVPPTPLIGRENEAPALCALLRREGTPGGGEARLLTLTGPPGTGKTRLGLQVAGELLDGFEDGVFFVGLAPVSDPDLLPSAIAQVLGVQETGGQPLLESLKGYLREKQLLLVLDNFEHLLEAAPVVAELLGIAPRLKVLATSRAALRLRGEKQFLVPPLALPDPEQVESIEALSQVAAVALFLQRAGDVKPGFRLTSENAPAVAEICRRLDGLPLAIELAAARVRLFSPQALLPRLESRLSLLTGGTRDAPVRQQTLQSAIAWSYDLLDEREKRLFHRLSVFVGHCSLEAAEAVCADAEARYRASAGLARQEAGERESPATEALLLGAARPDAILDGLAALVDKNLLLQAADPDGEPRFGMLETLREFGLQCLRASGEEPVMRRRHARYLASVAERLGSIDPPQRGERLQRLERDHDNFRAALAWSQAQPGEVETMLRLAGNLGQCFWYFQGNGSEGRRWLQEALARSDPSVRTTARAQALNTAAFLSMDQAASRALQGESISIWRELGDTYHLTLSLTRMGLAVLCEGDPAAARACLEEAVTVAQETGRRWVLSLALAYLRGVAWEEGDEAAARALSQESVTIAREVGDPWILAIALLGQGVLAMNEGDYPLARSSYEESLSRAREATDRELTAHMVCLLGEVARDQGDYPRARSLWEEYLALARAIHNPWSIARAQCGLGLLAYAERGIQSAQALLEESVALRRELEDRRGVASCLIHLARVALVQGDDQTASALLNESKEIGQVRNDPALLANYLRLEAQVALHRDEGERAAIRCAESFALWQKGGSRLDLAVNLETMAGVAVLRGQPEQAARLLGAAAALREAIGCPLPPVERGEYEERVAAVRAALGDAAFTAACAEGRALTLDQAVAAALELA